MLNIEAIAKKIFSLKSTLAFNDLALEIFHLQYANNPLYRRFVDLINIDAGDVQNVASIPFLPIEFFKSHKVITGNGHAETEFTSSGTTGSLTSTHHLISAALYRRSFSCGFQHFYGNVKDYRILALLPGYLERSGSSLIYMVNDLIDKSGNVESGFFLDDFGELRKKLLAGSDLKTLLIGVSHALLDFIEDGKLQLKNTIVMETGGMKGRRKELTRDALHGILRDGFGVDTIHSEYGMTELLSQAYALKAGHFETPPWMSVSLRDINDPLSPAAAGRTGGVNIIDLANIYSCCFIATSDLGRKLPNGKTEILGRFDYSDMRGCNLLF